MSHKTDQSSIQTKKKDTLESIEPNKWKQVRESEEKAHRENTNFSEEEIEKIINSNGSSNNIELEQEKIDIKDYIQKLIEENEKLQKKCEEAEKALGYSRAEILNNAQRHEKALETARRYAGSDTINAFIALIDSLEAEKLQDFNEITLEQMKEGTKNILDLTYSIFKKLGVIEINSTVGETFDPHIHSAVATEISKDSTQKSDVIVKVLRKGYRLHERVLRPAMVIISQVKD